MNDLPLELIDAIFGWLDGVSLARSKRVCRRWKELHKQPNYNSLWKNICWEEIDHDIIEELTECYSNNVDDDGGESREFFSFYEVHWDEVYKEWYRSRYIGKWPTMAVELIGHNGPVWDAKFSGDRIVTCGADCSVRIWDGWTGQCLQVLTGHAKGVLCIALRQRQGTSPKVDKPHDLIISGSQDNSICIWDMDEGVCLRSLFGHTHWVNSIAVQENLIVSGSDEISVKVWDFEQDTPDVVFSLAGDHDDWVKAVSLWKNLILTCTDTGLMTLWSKDSGELLSSVRNNNDGKGMSGALLRGNTALALSCSGHITAWQHCYSPDCPVSEATVLRNYSVVGPPPSGVQQGECIALRGSLVAIGTPLGAVFVYYLKSNWDLEFKDVHAIVQSCHCRVNSVAIDDDGEGPTMVTAGDDGIARVHRWFPYSAAW